MANLRKLAILAGGVLVAVIAAGAAAWALDGKSAGASGGSAAATTATQGSNAATKRADKSGFKLGDRLPENKATASPTAYKEIKWDDLMPKDWDPAKLFKSLNLGHLNDADPRAIRALEQLKEMWDNAPTSSALNGALDASRSGTSMGNAGYRLNADVVEAHTKKP